MFIRSSDIRLTLVGAVVLIGAAGAVAAGPTTRPAAYTAEAGPNAVSVVRYDWHDAKRDRDVPATVYCPAGKARCPVIVFSHGLGGTRDGYEYLGRHWASYGYVSVHVQHIGSDDSVWRGAAQPMEAMRRAARDPKNAVERPRDVSFAIDQLETLNADAKGPLHGRLDLKRIGVAGHSFGAYTALASAGRRIVRPRGDAIDEHDPRIRACIAMSAPAGRFLSDDAAYTEFTVPCLHMTGTLDESPIVGTTAKDRRIPFDSITKAEQYLVTFEGGDHMVFSGVRRAGRVARAAGGGARPEKDARFQDLIRMSTTAFWDAYLRDDANARAWLKDGGFAGILGRDGTFEVRMPTTRPTATAPARKR